MRASNFKDSLVESNVVGTVGLNATQTISTQGCYEGIVFRNNSKARYCQINATLGPT